MEIRYFGFQRNLIAPLEKRLASQKLSLLPCKNKQLGEVLILFSPLYWNDHYLFTDYNWKAFLEQHAGKCKMISAGFYAASELNYLDLLNLPNDFSSFFAKARTAEENWQPIFTDGLDMNQKLKLFFKGHGKESIIPAFSHIIRVTEIVNIEAAEGTSLEELNRELIEPTNIVEKWHIFHNRWQAYYPFFGCLPFFSLFEKIDQTLEKIVRFFTGGCSPEFILKHPETVQHVHEIKNLLTEAEGYVCY